MENESTRLFKRIQTHLPKQSFRLPEEILEEILLMLPVKSLLKLRCVSKPWRSLIDSKRFIQKHLHTWTENPNFTHHNIILESIGPRPCPKQCSLLSMLNDPFTVQFTFSDLENTRWDSIRIVGCCNGLVCLLLDREHFILWNPSTRKTKKLPDMDHKINLGYIKNCGFGFDDLSGDYMVFVIVMGFSATYKVYSLQTNSWREVKRGTLPYYSELKFATGKLHWSRLSATGWIIASFDLHSEVHGEVELPCSSNKFGVVGGRLSLICDRDSHLDIWVLKEYGVKESWERVATLPSLHNHTAVRSPYESLLAIGPNGEILLSGLWTFGIYYPEGDGFRQCQVRNHGLFGQALIYVESLVPLE